MISRETLKRLAGIYSEQGTAISFYFKPQTPQNKAHQAEPILIKDKVRKLLGSLSGMQRNKAGEDLQRILKISEELRVTPRAKAIFACKEHDLWIDLDIDTAPETRLRMGKYFQLAPLLAGSQDEPRCCIVILDREKTRLFHMRGPEIIEQSEVIDDEPREVRITGAGGSSHLERQKEEPVKQHFKFVADHLLYFFDRDDFDLLIVGIHDQLWAEFEPKLHPSLRQILIGRFPADPGLIGIEQVKEHGRKLFEQRRNSDLQELLRSIHGESQRNALGAIGLAAVISALEKGEVDTLLISDQELGPGAECTNCGHLMADTAAKCEICNQETRIFDNAAECLVRRIIVSNNVDLEILSNDPQLKRLGGVAAQLRFRADQSTAQKLAG
jgi:peptide subunit release factor 1 (eRF1)